MRFIYLLTLLIITSGYAEDLTQNQMMPYISSILLEMSKLSKGIKEVNDKVSKLENKFNSMEHEMKRIVNHVDEMAVSVINSVVTEIVTLKTNISFDIKEHDSKITMLFHNLSSELAGKEENTEVDSSEMTMTMLFHNLMDELKVYNESSELAGKEENTEVDSRDNCRISKEFLGINETLQDMNTSFIENSEESRPENCDDVCKQGIVTLEPVQIFPYSCCPDDSVNVLCDQTTELGGWTIIQQRRKIRRRENFYRNWTEYVSGFGNLKGEFWVGLKLIHELTQQTPQQLYISLEDWEGETRWAKYSNFSVAGPDDNYRLNVSGFTGDAGDSLGYHNGFEFTTYDNNNGGCQWCSPNCAEKYYGGWWFDACYRAHLNGLPAKESRNQGINWATWRPQYALRSASMKIRPLT